MASLSSKDIKEYDAIVNLARTVAGLQQEPTYRQTDTPSLADEHLDDEDVASEDDEFDEDASPAIVGSMAVHSSRSANVDDRLRQRFLDRFAEMVSERKGGKYVACTAMRELGNHVIIFATYNKKFDREDVQFLKDTQDCLCSISKEPSTASKRELMRILVQRQKHRLQTKYIPDVKVSLQSLLNANGSSADSRGCLASLSILQRLYSSLRSRNDVPAFTILEDLTTQALAVRRSMLVQECLVRHSQGSKALRALNFLAKVATAHEVLVDMAIGFPQFRSVEVKSVSVSPYEVTLPLNLDEALRVLKHEHQDTRGVHQASANQVQLPEKAQQDFNRFASEERHMHAEIQLVTYLAERSVLETIYPYIGGSKYCCLLCWEFISGLKLLQARGCHGKLYHRWLLPKLKDMPEHTQNLMLQATTSLKHRLKEFIMMNGVRAKWPEQAESSQAITTVKSDYGSLNHDEKMKRDWNEQSDKLSSRREATMSLDEPLGSLTMHDDVSQLPGLTKIQCHSSTCIICAKGDANICATCKSASYCSARCQARDWPLHSKLCATMAIIKDKRPTRNHNIAILFPEATPSPQLIWIKCTPMRDEDDGTPYQTADLENLLGDECFPGSIHVGRNSRRSYNIDHSLVLRHRDAFLYDSSSQNSCITQLTAGARPHEWKGPFVLMSKLGMVGTSLSNYDHYCDVDLADLRTAVDYFIDYLDESVQVNEVEGHGPALHANGIRGVLMTCRGDQRAVGWNEYMYATIPTGDEILYASGRGPSIPQHLGIPLLSRRYAMERPEDEYADVEGAWENRNATFLHMECNLEGGNIGWGWANFEWQTHVGNVLIARADRNAITPRQVEAMCRYCREILRPMFAERLESDDKCKDDFVKQCINHEAFEEYFNDLRVRKANEDPGWKFEVCPK